MTSNLPLIRLSAINPFLLELRRRGADAESLLQSLGLPRDIPASDELFVSSLSIYEFVEQSAETAGDPYLGFEVGSALELHEPDLTVEKAAKICGHDRRRLSRELRDEGTTLSKEIARLRAKRAEQDLAGTSRRVADIAQTVGFTDPTVFSRAFKNWTGQSPQEYRRTHKSP